VNRLNSRYLIDMSVIEMYENGLVCQRQQQRKQFTALCTAITKSVPSSTFCRQTAEGRFLPHAGPPACNVLTLCYVSWWKLCYSVASFKFAKIFAFTAYNGYLYPGIQGICDPVKSMKNITNREIDVHLQLHVANVPVLKTTLISLCTAYVTVYVICR
jgi:hypothetical protein